MKAYKLTDEFAQTRNGTQWGPGVTITVQSLEERLCSGGWIHFYTNPLIAVLMNIVHANFIKPRLWECETSGEELHEPLKSGARTLTTIREIPLPSVTTKQRVVFGILCTKQVYQKPDWTIWADAWLTGKNTSGKDGLDKVIGTDEDRTIFAARIASTAVEYFEEKRAFFLSGRASALVCADQLAAIAANHVAIITDGPFVEIAEKAMTYK